MKRALLFRACCFFALIFSSLIFNSCYFLPEDIFETEEIEDAPVLSFWVVPNLSDDVKARYSVNRAYLAEIEQPTAPDDMVQSKMIGASSGPFDEKFKVTVPESLKGLEGYFIMMEFTRQSSTLDNITFLQAYPSLVSILKSFHAYKLLAQVPENSTEISVSATTSDMKMGSSPAFISILTKIPGVPYLCKVEFENYQSAWGNPVFGVVSLPSQTDPPGISISSWPISFPPTVDTNDVVGYCGGDDWYLIINSDVAESNPAYSAFLNPEGQAIKMWIFSSNGIYWTDSYTDPQGNSASLVLPAAFGTIIVNDLSAWTIPIPPLPVP